MENATTIKKDSDFYNILRVFAIFTAVIGHATYAAWNGDGGGVQLNSNSLSPRYYSYTQFVGGIGGWIYGFHMPLFFALSGALYTYSKKIGTFSEVLTAKLNRLVLPYYLVGLFYMFPIKLLSGFYSKTTFFKAGQAFLFGGCSGHLWFLLALFWCFILMYFFERYIARKNLAIAGVLICFLYNFNLSAGFSGLKYFVAVPSLSSALNYFPYFFGGYAFEEIRKKYNFSKFWVRIVFVALLFINFIQYRFYVFDNAVLKAVLGIALFYSFSMLLAEYNAFLHNKVFAFFLCNAMAIYLFHDPLNFVVLALANKTGMCATNFGALIYILCRTLGVILVSCAIGEGIRVASLKNNKRLFIVIALFWLALILLRKVIW